MLSFSCAHSDELGYDGYNSDGKTVEEKLNELKNDKSFNVYEQGSWIIASSQEGVMFSFTPSNHPAHPAYVERHVIERDGAIYIDMSARCGASKENCDELVRSFQELNKKIMQNMGD
ncbi:MAG: molecular chaperone DnaJ [Paraglaciecola sp.]|uniref:molecular chaperone DnaJ n=1 Tax=Paraglaciecola sp. TaxID=1920173 RepID=UPI003296DB8E